MNLWKEQILPRAWPLLESAALAEEISILHRILWGHGEADDFIVDKVVDFIHRESLRLRHVELGRTPLVAIDNLIRLAQRVKKRRVNFRILLAKLAGRKLNIERPLATERIVRIQNSMHTGTFQFARRVWFQRVMSIDLRIGE